MKRARKTNGPGQKSRLSLFVLVALVPICPYQVFEKVLNRSRLWPSRGKKWRKMKRREEMEEKSSKRLPRMRPRSLSRNSRLECLSNSLELCSCFCRSFIPLSPCCVQALTAESDSISSNIVPHSLLKSLFCSYICLEMHVKHV